MWLVFFVMRGSWFGTHGCVGGHVVCGTWLCTCELRLPSGPAKMMTMMKGILQNYRSVRIPRGSPLPSVSLGFRIWGFTICGMDAGLGF